MKKKILALMVCAIVAVSFMGVSSVFAAETLDGCTITNINRLPDMCTTSGFCDYNAVPNCGLCCVLNSIYTITDWVFVILMAISSLMIIYGAVLFTTSQGNPDSVSKARQLILFAAVGIAVALFSRAIPPAVKMILGA